MPVFPFAAYSSADARRFAVSLGTVDDRKARSCVVLLGSVPEGGELLLRADDLVLQNLPAVCEEHQGPMFVVSNRNAGSQVSALDTHLWSSAETTAKGLGAVLLDWLVVEGSRVASLAPSSERWTVRCSEHPKLAS